MCGICGLVGRGLPENLPATIRAMTAALAHRGPDAQDDWLDARRRSASGHARLSIIDRVRRTADAFSPTAATA